MPARNFDAVVVGAGVVGAACAHALRAAGLTVAVLDRGEPAGGTTSAGEGNVLVSDKQPGPELDLALRSRALWPGLVAGLGEAIGAAADVEWETKGGLVAAVGAEQHAALCRFAQAQRTAGVDVMALDADAAREREPWLRPDLAGAAFYPDDAQVQPTLAATALLAAVRAAGGTVLPGVEAIGVRCTHGRVDALVTTRGDIGAGLVVNACGPWAGQLAERLGLALPIQPRRGVVLVTAPLPAGTIRHKVYDADYVDAVASADADLQVSTVVEATAAGTVLIGSSRQRVGFDDSLQVKVMRALAAKAVALLPELVQVPVMRAYGGYRPYAPDHLPVIGPDPRLTGLWHATGHEGAGIGLAPATGELLADLIDGRTTVVDPAPFRVDRLLGAAAAGRAAR